MNKTVLTSFTILCLLSTVILMGIAFDVQPVRAELNGTIKAVVLDSWGADYSVYTIYPLLNSEWSRYGSIPIVIDYTILNKEEISYSDLALTEANVLIISHAYPHLEHVFTDMEIAAIKQYVEEGHGIIGTYGTLVPENNRKLAELFGMNQSISYIFYPSGPVSTGIFNILGMTHPLFVSLPNPFSVPTVSETIYVPSHDWTVEGVTDGTIVALTTDNEAAIITCTTTYKSIYFTNEMEEREGPMPETSIQVFYNAIVWAGSRTWTVDDDGPADFDTIQEAINNATEGDTIFVLSGTYYGNVIVNKSLWLIGENRTTTIIDGNSTGNVIEVKANSCRITEFTIKKCGIQHNGIYVGEGNTGNNISYNIITDNWMGESGIYVDNSSNNIIIENSILHNFNGVQLSFSGNNRIIANNISNPSIGIRLAVSSNNTISENHIVNSYNGIKIDSSSNNTITNNNVMDNRNYPMYIYYSSNNKIYHNNFINNTKQVGNVLSNNTWDNGYPSGGNYWSNYTGNDNYSGLYQNETGSDGIGDTPYIIDKNNMDRYPAIIPFMSFNDLRTLYSELQGKYEDFKGEYTDLYSLYNNLNATYSKLKSEQEITKSLMSIFIATTIIFMATTVYLAIRKPKIKP